MISTLIPAITRIFGKVPITKHFNLSYNTSGVGTGKLLCTLRASVARPLLVNTRVEVVTAFNATTANTFIVGTTVNGTDILGASDITEGTVGFYPSGSGTGLKRIVANTAIYATSYGNKATSTLTTDNTAPSNGSSITLGTTTYTFKSALTPTVNEILIGSADASLLNLFQAINASGGTNGTNYYVSAANNFVSAATSVTTHAGLVTSLYGGTVANAIPTTSTGTTHMTFTSTVLAGGTDATTGNANLYLTVTPLFQGT